MLAKYYVMIITMVLGVGSLIWIPLSTNTFAQPTWETYEDEDCGIKIDHQYEDDMISSDLVNEFTIYPMPHFDDPDFIFMHIEVTCSSPTTPITQEMMELAQTEAITPDTEVEGHYAVIYEEISFDKYNIDDELTGSVKAGGQSGFGDTGWVELVLLTNHGDKQYKINLGFVGGEGISGFGKIYTTLEDHILNSIRFTE